MADKIYPLMGIQMGNIHTERVELFFSLYILLAFDIGNLCGYYTVAFACFSMILAFNDHVYQSLIKREATVNK
jgi:hypothetical protein